jgi:hypothetical protein
LPLLMLNESVPLVLYLTENIADSRIFSHDINPQD